MKCERVVKFLKSIITMMKQHPNFTFCIMILITLILKYRPGANGALETAPAPNPISILSNDSSVIDSPSGSLLIRNIVTSQFELTLVIYYAPWCAKSIAAMRQFEQAAEGMKSQVNFIAVNCWWIQGECRGEMMIQKFPKIYLHHQNIKKPVLYNGPLAKDYFMDFLHKVMNPLTYLGTESTAQQFLQENQLTAIAYSKFSSSVQEKSFLKYFVLAIKHLENYPALPMQFCVITSKEIADKYYLKQGLIQVRDVMKPRVVTQLNLNSTFQSLLRSLAKFYYDLIYPDINLPEEKSNLLQYWLSKGPTVLTFVSSTEFKDRENFINKVSHLVTEYSKCVKNSMSVPSSSNTIYTNIPPQDRTCCKTIFTNVEHISDAQDSHIICNVCLKSNNSTVLCGVFNKLLACLLRDVNFQNTLEMHVMEAESSVFCSELLPLYDHHRTRLNLCCTSWDFFQKEMPSVSYTDFTNNLYCDVGNFTAIKTLESDLKSQTVTPCSTVSINLSGLSCKTNRTLRFIALDFAMHGALSDNLGVSEHMYDVDDLRLGAAIVDSVNEMHHVMKSTQFNLENFILNYTLGNLPRSYRSKHAVHTCMSNASHVCIQEVTSETFDEFVLNNEKNVLLLYYVPWCAGCSSISHIFISLAYLLTPSNIILARIDGYENDLPWQFAVQSYPTILWFPSSRSSYSVKFPNEEDITLANLLRFVLQNGDKTSIKQILFNLCISDRKVRHEACKKWKKVRNK